VSDGLDHARYPDVGTAREARLILGHGNLPARPPAAPRRFPADSGHAR
jgi:hypothetical protein